MKINGSQKQQLQSKIVKSVHEETHQGLASTVERIRDKYFFPGAYAICKRIVSTCEICQKMGDKPKKQKHLLIDTSSGYPWQKVSMDICGPFPRTKRGNRFMITIKDCFSRYLEAYAIPDATSKTTIRIFSEKIIARYGTPEILLTDNGRNFNSKEMIAFCSALGIKKTNTTPYIPQANGIVERAHKDLKDNVRKMMMINETEWDEELAHTLMTLNTAINRTTGVSPFFALFGRSPVMPYDVMRPKKEKLSAFEYGDQLRQNLTRIHQQMRERNDESHEITRKYYKDEKVRKFEIGDLVACSYEVQEKGKPKKLSQTFMGPFKVTAVIGDLV